MAESGTEGAEYFKFLAEQEESGNVSASGMFSIQVLAKALAVWGLSAVSLSSPAAAAERAEPQHEWAFVCNLNEHWFTVRKVQDGWYNFNSLFPGPEPLSQFYLSAFLGSLQEQGYTIHVIKGLLPAEPHSDRHSGAGSWFSPAEARAAAQQSQRLKKAGFLKAAVRGALDLASAAGTKMTLRPTGGTKRNHGSMGTDQDDADLQRALAASRAETYGSVASLAAAGSTVGGDFEADEDADLAAAIAASLQGGHNEQPGGEEEREAGASSALPALGEEPAAGEGVLEIGIRLPSGERHSRRFARTDSVGHVAALAAVHGVDMGRHRLATSFPRAVLQDWGQPLSDARVGNKQVLAVEPS